eukprot:scaffold79050_cov124-Phaeocystis_antarctica.AAC.1
MSLLHATVAATNVLRPSKTPSFSDTMPDHLRVIGNGGWLHFYLGKKFRKTDVDVVLARPHAPGRLGTSQLSNPRTQWVAPSARVA